MRAGNVTSRTFSGSTATLSYDLLDRLTKWFVSSTDKEQYAYDASGNRVLRRSTTSSSTTIIVYAFGLEEHQYSSSGTNQWNTYYYSLAGHLIGSLDGNGTTFYLTDALGSLLTSFTNAPGGASVKGEQSFAPYGTAQYYQGNLNTAKGFTGQYNDALSGLDYYNARYYDPVVGVFLSADSVQGNPQGLNPYAYVGGNPETRSDPTGRYLVGPGGQRYYPGVPHSSPAPAGNPAPSPEMVGSASGPAASSRERSEAYLLAQYIAAWRQFTGDTDFADYAAAEWYLTDQNGNGDCFLCADTLFGSHFIGTAKSSGRDELNDPTHTSDAEQQLRTDWLTKGGAAFAVLASKLARMANVHAILHIVLFTELPPCDQCQGFFDTLFLPVMAAIATAIMNGPPALDPWPSGEVGIQFDVYAKNPVATGGDWRMPINSPSDLLPEFHKDIPFTYAAPDGTA
jgi:RHS repeat-associated protein